VPKAILWGKSPKTNGVFAIIHPKSNGVLDENIHYPIVFEK
jgi:hypothetical protein